MERTEFVILMADSGDRAEGSADMVRAGRDRGISNVKLERGSDSGREGSIGSGSGGRSERHNRSVEIILALYRRLVVYGAIVSQVRQVQREAPIYSPFWL